MCGWRKEYKIIMEDQGFRIGEVQISGKLVLGPMAGVTDLPFRLLCKEQGADLVYTEMISAKGIYYKNKNTELLWMTEEHRLSTGILIFLILIWDARCPRWSITERDRP